jgi:CheY-like chemotaxis protein
MIIGDREPGSADRHASRDRILVVDDNPLIVQALYHTFSNDCQVFMATSGESAIEVCRERQPDLVLLDVMMPGLDGYQTCERLKADPATSDIPVIFVTGQSDSAAEVRGLAAGAVDFIVKPFKAVNETVFTCEPLASGSTRFSWTMSGDRPWPMVVLAALLGLDRMLARQFDEGLAMLKALAERRG